MSVDRSKSTETIDDHEKGLHLSIYRKHFEGSEWYQKIIDHAQWYRVKYKSARFDKTCETPCWTNFYGGMAEYTPYSPVPDWLQPLVDQVSSLLGTRFNAILLRLYFDGKDEIAWHTDGRTFLGDTPTIASLSFGADAEFQMRRMNNVWPPVNGSCGDCVDRNTPERHFTVGAGDLLVMRGVTQKYWHHRVPKQKCRKPRLNINFRYIIRGEDAERGQKTYYKYMVHGDDDDPPKFNFAQIISKRGGLLNFATRKRQLCNTTLDNEQSSSLGESASGVTEPRREQKHIPSIIKSTFDMITPTCSSSCDMNVPGSPQMLPDKIDSDTLAYLESEVDVEASTFFSLPIDIQIDLVQNWKEMRKRKEPKAEKQSDYGLKGRKKAKHVSHTKETTLHRFFRTR